MSPGIKPGEVLRLVAERYEGINEKMVGACLGIPGQKAYNVKVGDLATVVEYIMLLGKMPDAAKKRA